MTDPLKPKKSRKRSLLKTLGSTALKAGGEAIAQRLGKKSSGMSSAALRLVDGLDELKGIAMKMGQMLSMAEEHDLLPPGWKDVLSRLQHSATPKEWSYIEPLLHQGLSNLNIYDQIDPEAIHAASIGQVHKAKLKDGRTVAIKVRYPGMEESLESDLETMRSFLKIMKLVPGERSIDEILDMLKRIFIQELNFTREKNFYVWYKKKLQSFPEFVVPEVIHEGCGDGVLTTEWIEGISLHQWITNHKEQFHEPDVIASRNDIGRKLQKLILVEIYHLQCIQSDPNPANFLISPDNKIVLLDFGSAQELGEVLVDQYFRLCYGAMRSEEDRITEAAMDLGFIYEKDSSAIKQKFLEVMQLVSEPFEQGEYSWENCRLIKRINEKSLKLAMMTRFRPPPSEVIFLNRRIAGNQLLMESLGPTFDAEEVVMDIFAHTAFLEKYHSR